MLCLLPALADKEPFNNFRELITSKGYTCPEVSEGEIGQNEIFYKITCKEVQDKIKNFYIYQIEQSRFKGWQVNKVSYYSQTIRPTLWGKAE